MKGAREFALLFPSGRYGRFYVNSGRHARGYYFHLYIVPDAKPDDNSYPTDAERVEVYGVVDGQPGWTESYGWLHKGRWESDFQLLIEAEKEAVERRKVYEKRQEKDMEVAEQTRIKNLLDKY